MALSSRLEQLPQGLLQRLCTCHPNVTVQLEGFTCDSNMGTSAMLKAVVTYSDEQGNTTASTVVGLFDAWIKTLENSSVMVDGIKYTLCMLNKDSPCSCQLFNNDCSTDVEPTMMNVTQPVLDSSSDSKRTREFSFLFIGGMLSGTIISCVACATLIVV